MKKSASSSVCLTEGTSRGLLAAAFLLVSIALPATLQAARFGVPDGVSDPPGYFFLTGPDIPTDASNGSWGDNTHSMDFFIEVTGISLRVDLYDPGLVSATAPNLDLYFGDPVGQVTYTLYDSFDLPVDTRSWRADTEGPAGSNLNLVTFYNGPAIPGVYRLNVTMDDDPNAEDRDINGFGISVPGYDFYSYHFTGGEAWAAGATITEPLVFYPHVLRSTPSTFNNEDITGVDVLTLDLDSADTNPPPDVILETPTLRGAPLNPSQDAQLFTSNLRGIEVSNTEGTDYGFWSFYLYNLGLVFEGANDLNIFSAQIIDYESGLTPDLFPVAKGDPTNPFRLYYSKDDYTPPLKETMIHYAEVISGPKPPLTGTSSLLEITVEIPNPSSYNLTNINVITSVNPDPQFTDPTIVDVSPRLAAIATGRDITITGAVDPENIDEYIKYQTTFTPTAGGVFYITGDGTDLQGGALPTEGTYNTPFNPAPPPDSERLGPIHMLRVEAIVNNCRITARLTGDLDVCLGDDLNLSAAGSIIIDCAAGVPEYRWTRDGIEVVPFPGSPNYSETPTVGAVYGVEVACSGIPGCTDYAEAQVVVVPAVVADAGLDLRTCQGAAALLGGTPAGSGGTGLLTYAWSPVTDLDDPSLANPTFTPSTPATPVTFTLTVTDEAGCAGTDDVIVDVDPGVTADAGPGFSTCQGIGVQIGGAPTASGGTGALTCSWAPATDLDDPSLCNPTCTPSSPSSPLTYTVTVTDEPGCTAQAVVDVTVSIDQPPQPVGNTLFLVREDRNVHFYWTLNGSFGYNVRRHGDKAFDRPTSDLLDTLNVGEYVATGEMDAAPDRAYYRVLSINCSGGEE